MTVDGELINPEIVYVLGTPEENNAPVVTNDFPFILIIALTIIVVIVMSIAALLERKKRDIITLR